MWLDGTSRRVEATEKEDWDHDCSKHTFKKENLANFWPMRSQLRPSLTKSSSNGRSFFVSSASQTNWNPGNIFARVLTKNYNIKTQMDIWKSQTHNWWVMKSSQYLGRKSLNERRFNVRQELVMNPCTIAPNTCAIGRSSDNAVTCTKSALATHGALQKEHRGKKL